MQLNHPIMPCLWFDTQAEEAAKFYCAVFPNSKVTNVSHYPDTQQDIHGKPAGSVMVAAFEINGQPFTAINGGPAFKLDEAISFQVQCDSQAEIDYYWNALLESGGEEGPCGWLKDRFGLSWQVVPSAIGKMMSGDPNASARVMDAFMAMKKMDLAALERAYENAA